MTARLPLSNHVALVTGAGRGIGAAISKQRADLGAIVLLCARTQKTLDSVAASISEQGGKAEARACDVSNLSSVQSLAAEVEKAHGRLDILVNNAGIGAFAGPLPSRQREQPRGDPDTQTQNCHR